MSKFAGKGHMTGTLTVESQSPIQTQTEAPDTHTFEGAQAWSFAEKSELFLLAVTNMVSENTFYESAKDRDDRFSQLVRNVTAQDPAWMQAFIPWLRRTANMRSAPIVALAEYIKAGGPDGRNLIVNTLVRGDEPAELTAYWLARYGKPLPQPLKRGISDQLNQLTEYEVLKYDSQNNAVRLGDVINLVHPKPADRYHELLFKYLLDRRYQGRADVDGRTLKVIKGRQQMEAVPAEDRREWAKAGIPKDYGVTWEYLSGWLPGGMDAEAWETVIPHMGYMALLRNLRNFDKAGISPSTRAKVQAWISDPARVSKSRQFPYRFWSAYKNTGSVNWVSALETALELSTQNVPELPGRTLVLTDTSASMRGHVSANSSVQHFEIAGLFAAAVGARNDIDLISFASAAEDLGFNRGDSVLRTIEKIDRRNGKVGHGTDLNPGLRYFKGHDRIVVFTDGQMWTLPRFPDVPVYIFDTSGYGRSPVPVGQGNVHTIGGFTDAAFKMIPLLEAGQKAEWPWV